MKNQEQELSEEDWFFAAKMYAEQIGFATSDYFEDYRMFYEGGLSPEEAVNEDLSNCQR